jgi:hypothetical protein
MQTKYIEQGLFPLLENQIDREIKDIPQPDWAKKAIVLHDLVRNEIDYHRNDHNIPPKETLLRGRGDCVDRSILLTNMYLDVGLDVRGITASKIGERMHHRFLQVAIPETDTDLACKHLRDGYENLFGDRPGKMTWTRIDGVPYFLADPGWSNYVGDRNSLTGDYIRDTSTGWKFNDASTKIHRSRRNTADAGSSSALNEPQKQSVKTREKSQSAGSGRQRQQKQGFVDQLDELADEIADRI